MKKETKQTKNEDIKKKELLLSQMKKDSVTRNLSDQSLYRSK